MTVSTCAQCGAPNEGDPYAISWACRRCQSQNVDPTVSGGLKERVIAGIAACDREDWSAAIPPLDEAIAAGLRSQRVLAGAALATAANATIPTLDRAAKRMSAIWKLWEQNDHTPEAEIATIWAEAQDSFARTTLRAMRFYIEEGDKAYFGYEETEPWFAQRGRAEKYSTAVDYAAPCIAHPPMDPSLRDEILSLTIRCCRISPNACDGDVCARAASLAGVSLEPEPPPPPSLKKGRLPAVIFVVVIAIVLLRMACR